MVTNASNGPLVVLGVPRSGTTALARGLVEKIYEGRLIEEPNLIWRRCVKGRGVDSDALGIRFRECQAVRRWLRKQGRNRYGLVEKTPANCVRPSVLWSVVPDATYLIILRDFDNCIASWTKKLEGRGDRNYQKLTGNTLRVWKNRARATLGSRLDVVTSEVLRRSGLFSRGNEKLMRAPITEEVLDLARHGSSLRDIATEQISQAYEGIRTFVAGGADDASIYWTNYSIGLYEAVDEVRRTASAVEVLRCLEDKGFIQEASGSGGRQALIEAIEQIQK